MFIGLLAIVFKLFQMLTGLAIGMIDTPLAASMFSLAKNSSLGAVASKQPLLDQALKPNTKLSPTLLLRSSGCSLYFLNLVSPCKHPPFYGVTTLEPLISPPIPSFMLAPNMWKLISTFFRDMVATKQLIVRFISSTDQLADLLTKPISSNRFLQLRTKLNVLSIPLGLRGRVKDKFRNLQLDEIKEESPATAEDHC